MADVEADRGRIRRAGAEAADIAQSVHPCPLAELLRGVGSALPGSATAGRRRRSARRAPSTHGLG